jgi:hypothetical protein
MARNLHYKTYSFRLNEKTKEAIKKLVNDSNLSYNLIFVGMLRQFKLKKYVEQRKRIQSKEERNMSALRKETDAQE